LLQLEDAKVLDIKPLPLFGTLVIGRR
jgi:hypothetical protein